MAHEGPAVCVVRAAQLILRCVVRATQMIHRGVVHAAEMILRCVVHALSVHVVRVVREALHRSHGARYAVGEPDVRHALRVGVRYR